MFESTKPNSNYTTPITSTDTLLKHILETHGHIYIDNKNVAYNNKSLHYKSLKELSMIDEAFHDTFIAKYGLTFTSFYFMALNYYEKLCEKDITHISEKDYSELTIDELNKESLLLIRELVSIITALHNIDSKLEVNIYDTFMADNHRYYRNFSKVLSKYDNLIRAILSHSDISLELKDEEIPTVDEETEKEISSDSQVTEETNSTEEVPVEEEVAENNDDIIQEEEPIVEEAIPETEETVSDESEEAVTPDIVDEYDIPYKIRHPEEVQTNETSEDNNKILPENVGQESEESEEAITPDIVPDEEYNMGVLPQTEIDRLLNNIGKEHVETEKTETIHLADGTEEEAKFVDLSSEEKEQVIKEGFDNMLDSESNSPEPQHYLEDAESTNTDKILNTLKDILIDSKLRNNIEDEYLSILKNFLHDGKLRKDLFENKNINTSADLGVEYQDVNIKQIHFRQTSNLSKIRELAQYNFYVAFELMNKAKIFYSFEEHETISKNGMIVFNIARLFLANAYIIKYVDDTKSAKMVK